MAIKTILAGLSGGSASNGALALACRFAARFGAHLEALHVRIDVAEVVMAAGAEGLAAATDLGWADQASGEVEATAEETRAVFEAEAARHGLHGASWRVETGDAAALVSRRARFFDLVVLGRSDRVIEAPHSDAIEETLFRSGRPALLAPAKPPPAVGERIAIGWNGSPEAVRAVVAARPFLRLAKETIVITIGAEKDGGAEEDGGGEALQAYLRLHGIAALLRNVPAVAGEGKGGQLLSAARDVEADLLVLGGYSRAPWREMLFGGTTSQVIGASLLPLLVAH